MIPLSFLRRLDSLKYTSVVALISIGYLVVLVVYHFARGDTIPDRGDIRVVESAGIVPILKSFPIIVFAYTCHQNVRILQTNADQKLIEADVLHFERNQGQLAHPDHFCCGRKHRDSLQYLPPRSHNRLPFLRQQCYWQYRCSVYVSDPSLHHRPLTVCADTPSVASTVGKAAIVVLVMFSYPLQVHPCRASVDAVLKWRPIKRNSSEFSSTAGSPSRSSLLGQSMKPGAKPARGEMSETRFAAITTVIIILSYIVAMTVSSLENVLAYVGSTGSTSISFILPGLFYYKISSPDSLHHQRLMKEDDDEEEYGSDDELDPPSAEGGWTAQFKGRHWRRNILRKLSLALAIYGVGVMITCLVANTIFHVGAAH